LRIETAPILIGSTHDQQVSVTGFMNLPVQVGEAAGP